MLYGLWPHKRSKFSYAYNLPDEQGATVRLSPHGDRHSLSSPMHKTSANYELAVDTLSGQALTTGEFWM